MVITYRVVQNYPLFRFKVVHREGSLDWLLQIKFLQLRDAGLYECQVCWPLWVSGMLDSMSVTYAGLYESQGC